VRAARVRVAFVCASLSSAAAAVPAACSPLAIEGVTGEAGAASPESAPAPRGDCDLLPADGVVGGWRRTEPVRVYTGPELYELIDGGAEVFFEQGFERVTVQQYALGSDEIGIELFAMRDAAAALAIYLARCGEETPVEGLELRHSAGRHELLAVQGRFYAVIENLSGRAERAADLLAFARALAPRLPAPEPVAALGLLPKEGRVSGSERLIRGPLALQAFIQLGEGDILQLAGGVTAAAAGYQGPVGRFTLVVAPYDDAEAARRVFGHLQANLDPEIRPLAITSSRLVFRDYSGTYGEAVLAGSRIELRLGLAAQP
jgi:hypothetical protein